MQNQCEKKKYYFRGDEYACSLELAMNIIGGKWKSMVVFHLNDGAMRSGKLQRALPNISNKMFTQTIRDLEKCGLIERIVYAVVPPKVEYRLTDKGQTVLPIVLQLADWGIGMAEKEDAVV
ncbi:MAG: helix-turn-helix transcriptional regulator [Alistipes sp.]|nr:helix-turn-helix transcriptional regulator [Alistipes sp.]